MQFLVTCLALLGAANAQRVSIGSPLDRAAVIAGQQTVIEIDRPNFLGSTLDVSVTIGIQSCATAPCASPSDIMGQILYSGDFKPQLDATNHAKPPCQNYTVTVPANLPKGPAQIGVAHFAMIGAGPAPFMETTNVTVIIQ